MQETLTQILAQTNHYLDVNLIAELLGVQAETIYRYCKENNLPHIKISNSLRFDPRHVSEWLKAHQYVTYPAIATVIHGWVCAHVLDRTLKLPIPSKLSAVLSSLGPDWFADARTEEADPASSDKAGPAMARFEVELEKQLTIADQRSLLVELACLAVTYA